MAACPIRFALRWPILVLTMSVLLAPAMRAHSAELKRLRVGTSGDYAPFSETQAGKSAYRGFDIAVAEAFARDRGYAIEWVAFR